VRLAFEKLDPRILPDMGVKVAFLEDNPAGAPGSAAGAGATPSKPEILLPKAAVRQDAGKDVVYVLVSGDHVERRAVRLGAGQGDQAVVTSGLAEGDQVVIEGSTDLKDGDPVKVQT
jgi:multidrug efflux pump subunit AcrA (membrane-fusion protein)